MNSDIYMTHASMRKVSQERQLLSAISTTIFTTEFQLLVVVQK
jgi:hypothetical protein